LSTASPLFVIPKICIPHCAATKFIPVIIKAVMVFGKRNLSVIVVVLLTLLLIAIVIWIYDKKMQEANKRMHQSAFSSTSLQTKIKSINIKKINHEKNFPFSVCIAACEN
jgi:hypothetical protein